LMRAILALIIFALIVFGTYAFLHKGEMEPLPSMPDFDTLPFSKMLTASSSPLVTVPNATSTPLNPSESIVSPAPKRKRVMTTYFWVGEAAGPENGYITNVASYFDSRWAEHFGGEDDPEDRCEYHPCSFTPKENPFYFALPYADLDHDGNRKMSSMRIPWYTEANHDETILKNRWIEIKYKNKLCYAQWADVGPFGEEDFDYVFGDNPLPKNKENGSAGLDVSPAVWDCLGMPTNDFTEWRFVEEKDVPPGPWKEIITRD
jgi:hypothetical protein